MPIIEYEKKYKNLFKSYNISNVFLITPQTSEKRIREIDNYSKAFIYMVASTNITGEKNKISKQQINYFKRIKEMNLKNKLIIGFGIFDKNTFKNACKYANGAIIGSAFINYLKKNKINEIGNFVKSIKSY